MKYLLVIVFLLITPVGSVAERDYVSGVYSTLDGDYSLRIWHDQDSEMYFSSSLDVVQGVKACSDESEGFAVCMPFNSVTIIVPSRLSVGSTSSHGNLSAEVFERQDTFVVDGRECGEVYLIKSTRTMTPPGSQSYEFSHILVWSKLEGLIAFLDQRHSGIYVYREQACEPLKTSIGGQ